MQKVFFTGTHRVRTPEETYESIRPLLRDYGITRLADVTGLDIIGIPVVMAVRPLATTLSVSQGKGATLLLAKISGAMEAVELWHAENAVPAPGLLDTPSSELDLPYEIKELAGMRGSLLTEWTRLDWIQAVDLVERTSVPVPRGAVRMGHPPADWRVPAFMESSNGLASGNTVAEATVHALYEVIERDAVHALRGVPASGRRYIDPASVSDDHCAELVERVSRAGAWLEIEYVPNRMGVPCVVAHLWHEDSPASVMFGAGAHADPAVALSRAVTEAVQARLTHITGTRDDLASAAYRPVHLPRPVTPGPLEAWDRVKSTVPGAHFATDTEEADRLAERIGAVTGSSPLRVVLADRDEFAVVKVLCPGTRQTPHSSVRAEAEARGEGAA
ncbi:YcaO-like family protein [Actinoallomurus sp. NPDC052308]|uniref:YcaO-like family protein n=1 Tax=Actinoallomurus sp. NPDC052308 TaxID=3155530 RepID=UPI003415036D